MANFGWSYPPGVTRLPWDEPTPCEVCGKDVDSCVCPECPVCGACGDFHCYETTASKGHGMIPNEEQVKAKIEADNELAQQDAYWEQYARDNADDEFNERNK